MAQISMTVRMDSELKKNFDNLCIQFGLSANAAMNVFARAVVQRGRIPFEIVSDQVASASPTQEAIDKFFYDKQYGVNEIEGFLSEHMRTPYGRK